MVGGIFITFEGVEGAGKTTQAHRLEKALVARTPPTIQELNRTPKVLVTREPGGTSISERIRDIFLNEEGIVPVTELLLIAAARAQHVAEVICPKLEADWIVICDRFTDSTLAYQGYRGSVDLARIHDLNLMATGGLKPDITFVLDLPVEVGIQRQQQQTSRDRLEREPLELHRKVREGYLAVAAAEPARVKLIDAVQSPDAVHAQILAEYQKYIGK